MSSRLKLVGMCLVISALLALGPAALVLAHGGGGGGGHGGGHGGGGYGGGHSAMSYHGGNYGHSNAFVHSGNFAHSNWNAWGHNSGNWHNGYWGRDRFLGFGGWWYPGLWGGFYGAPWWYGNYGYADYVYDDSAYYPDSSYVATVPSTVPIVAETATEPTTESDEATSGPDFHGWALEAFREGNYANAVRFAGHAAIENPRDANIHLLLSLSMFALKNYPGAAMETHAWAGMGGKIDWPMLIGFYNNNVNTYTPQLRALEEFVGKNPPSAPGRFLLGFHYLAGGHREAAQGEFLHVLDIVPKDRIAANLLTLSGGRVPDSVARQLKKIPEPPGTIQLK